MSGASGRPSLTVRYVEAQPESGPHKPAMPAHWVIEDGLTIVSRPVDIHVDDLTARDTRQQALGYENALFDMEAHNARIASEAGERELRSAAAEYAERMQMDDVWQWLHDRAKSLAAEREDRS